MPQIIFLLALVLIWTEVKGQSDPKCSTEDFTCLPGQIKLSGNGDKCTGGTNCAASCCKDTCQTSGVCSASVPLIQSKKDNQCGNSGCEVKDCCEDAMCKLAEAGSYYQCPTNWVPSIPQNGDNMCQIKSGCVHGDNDDKNCCDHCSRIVITEPGTLSGVNLNGNFISRGTHNGKLYWQQPGQGGKKHVFIYFDSNKWYVGQTLNTADAINSLVSSSDLPLSSSPSTDTWASHMVLKCDGHKNSDTTCESSGPLGGMFDCKAHGNSYFLRSVTNAQGKCQGTPCSALKECCEQCDGFGVTVTGNQDFDFTGIFDTPVVVGDQVTYTRQDGGVTLSLDPVTREWCLAEVGNEVANHICFGSEEDSPSKIKGKYSFECLTPVPVRKPRDCDGRWKDVGKCTLPCKINGQVGEQEQIFIVEAPANWRGAECLAKDHTTRKIPCHDRPCPDDCIGRWNPELDRNKNVVCSKPCGWGVTHLKYEVQKPATGKGHQCEHQHNKIITKPCFKGKCVAPATSSSSSTVAAP